MEKEIKLNLNSGMVHYCNCYLIRNSKKMEEFYTFDEAKAYALNKGLTYQKCSKCIKKC